MNAQDFVQNFLWWVLSLFIVEQDGVETAVIGNVFESELMHSEAFLDATS